MDTSIKAPVDELETVTIHRCQFCYHWQVASRYNGTCDMKKHSTHRSAVCEKWKHDAITEDV